jgi:hypothetical protein
VSIDYLIIILTIFAFGLVLLLVGYAAETAVQNLGAARRRRRARRRG